MTISNPNTVDVIGVEVASGAVILTVVDDLDWVSDLDHLRALECKLNTYVAFIESGEIDETYPNARGRNRVIDVVCRFPLPTAAEEYYAKATAILADAGIQLR